MVVAAAEVAGAATLPALGAAAFTTAAAAAVGRGSAEHNHRERLRQLRKEVAELQSLQQQVGDSGAGSLTANTARVFVANRHGRVRSMAPPLASCSHSCCACLRLFCPAGADGAAAADAEEDAGAAAGRSEGGLGRRAGMLLRRALGAWRSLSQAACTERCRSCQQQGRPWAGASRCAAAATCNPTLGLLHPCCLPLGRPAQEFQAAWQEVQADLAREQRERAVVQGQLSNALDKVGCRCSLGWTAGVKQLDNGQE